LMLHGAMVAQGYDDCDEDMIRHVRDIVGPTTVIDVELNLHCHLTPSMIAHGNYSIWRSRQSLEIFDRRWPCSIVG
jgi:microcystin degradation protein MlrC